MEWCEGDDRVPPGYKFYPTEQELVSYYLLRKVLGFIDDTVLIPVCDLYGDTNPWDLWEILKESQTFNGSEVYVFTTLKRKSVKDARVTRSVGLGCWSGEDAAKAVYDGQNRGLKIGSRKRFRFEKSGTDHDGGWIMMEYRLENSWLEKIGVDVKDHNIVSDLVICKLKKNTRRQPKSVSVVVASSSSVTDEENDNNGRKRKRGGLQADEVVSENNKRLKEASHHDELKELTESLERDLLAVEYDHYDESNDELKKFTESLGRELLAVEYDHHDESNDELKKFTESIERDLLAVEYDHNDESNDELKKITESLEKELLAMEYDRHDESKGREYKVNSEVIVEEPFFNFGDFGFEGFDSNGIQWDDSSSNMFFDMDWIHNKYPELAAPSTDNFCNLNPQTSTSTTDEVVVIR
ncbi:hypothetical protein L6164_022870 [Bauhinia variegata]|uniref:Uncharacterized protein n=1 Tax=Bauhinia variegata TaxID=167791 RepID=A0ACB9MH36_BAUVA|nr:hypothetical protein L6164_022870 [Bauhinia variegata]